MSSHAETEFAEAIGYGESLRDQGMWEEAAKVFARAGTLALDHGAVDAGRKAYGAAGELFRRADRVVEARDALRVALSKTSIPDEERAVLLVRLSGCYTELGRGSAALELLDQARQLTQPGTPLRVLVVDAIFGTLLGWGPVSALPPLLEELAPSSWSSALRGAQLDRLCARFDDADAKLGVLEAELADAGAEVGLGGVRGERAELAALRGDAATSADVWLAARDSHQAGGRAGLMWRAEAGRVRCLVQAGLEPFPNRLEEGLAWADSRQLSTLKIDLGLALGIARGDGVLLAHIRDRADELGLVRRAGRAELARCEGLAGPAALAPLQDVLARLEGDRPHQLRARTLHAIALAGMARAAGVTAAKRLVPELQAAGMRPELERIQSLLEE